MLPASLNLKVHVNKLLTSVGEWNQRRRKRNCWHPRSLVVDEGGKSRCLECGLVETRVAMSMLRQRNCPHLSGWQLVEEGFRRDCLDCGKQDYETTEYRRRLEAETGTLIISSDKPSWRVRVWKRITFRSPKG